MYDIYVYINKKLCILQFISFMLYSLLHIGNLIIYKIYKNRNFYCKLHTKYNRKLQKGIHTSKLDIKKCAYITHAHIHT